MKGKKVTTAELQQIPKTNYKQLNRPQQEIFNFQKVAALLADYGFDCMRFTDDWNGADFLAYNAEIGLTLKVQLKGRLTIGKHYLGKDLFITFPIKNKWYIVYHDLLVSIIGEESEYLKTKSWKSRNGLYHSDAPNQNIIKRLAKYRIGGKILRINKTI